MTPVSPQLDIDVVGFGNALVDVLSHQEDQFIDDIGAIKGAMNLIDKALKPLIRISGGADYRLRRIGCKHNYWCQFVWWLMCLYRSSRCGRSGRSFSRRHEPPRHSAYNPFAPTEDSTGRCIVLLPPMEKER